MGIQESFMFTTAAIKKNSLIILIKTITNSSKYDNNEVKECK